MNKIIISLVSFLLISSIMIAKDIYKKPIVVKNPYHSVNFVTSDGQLYHSNDFGLSFEKVEGVIYPKIKVEKLITSDNSYFSLKGDILKYSIDENIEGFVNFKITNIEGDFENITVNTELDRTGIIKLKYSYKLLILNLESSTKLKKTFKLINN